MKRSKKRIVAIDYGLVRIGLALSDSEGKIALPYKTIDAGKSVKESALSVKKALEGVLEEVATIIVGNPLLLKGTRGEMAKKVCAFAKALEEVFELSILLWDERLTSSMATRSLKEELGLSRRQRKGKEDTTAALFLLQSYMESLS